jgi:hypothetical protein
LLEQNEVVTVGAKRRLPPITVPGTSAKIFIGESQIRPLDPVVTRISPAHDSREVSPVAPIVIHFSEPMDTGGAESAFSTTPPVKGAFSWTAANDEPS